MRLAHKFIHVLLMKHAYQTHLGAWFSGNSKVDELARERIHVSIRLDWELVESPLSSCALALDFWTISCRTVKSFLLHFPAFARLRLKDLNGRNFGKPGKIAGIDISRLNNFVASSKHFVNFENIFDQYLGVFS